MAWEDQELSLPGKKQLILNQVSIIDVFKHYGVDVDGEKIPCPLPSHNDGVASFMIYRDTNSFYCFGCNAHSNVIDFVIAMEECSFVEAIDKLMPLRKENNHLAAEKVEDLKDAYTFNMYSDLRDFLSSLKGFAVYESEKENVDIIFTQLEDKLMRTSKDNEKDLKKIKEKVDEYIEKRKQELMEKLDGYNEVIV